MGVVIAIVIIAVVLGLLGIIVKGLLWLLIIGIALLVAAVAYGVLRGRNARRT